jgi:hypothetical protein
MARESKDGKFYAHLKAFLLAHQIGEDPNKNLAKLRIIANTNPDRWDGKLPTSGIRADTNYCKVVETTKSRPIKPWWWYAKGHEPVPSVVQDIYRGLSFDFSVVYPQENAWIYINVEPPQELLKLLSRQEYLRAFILISLANKNFKPAQREHKRLRLGSVMGSEDLRKIFTFVACQEGDERYRSIRGTIPTITRLVHPSSNTANWSILLPEAGRNYGSLRDLFRGR